MYCELYSDDLVDVIAVMEYGATVRGLMIRFKSLLARRLHYKTNSSMFVYKGRWFKGEVEIDRQDSLFMRVDRFGYILVDGSETYFREVSDLNSL